MEPIGRRRIGLITCGSRADLQPFLLLARKLKQRGYQPEILTHEAYRETVQSKGFEFFRLGGNPDDFIVENSKEPGRIMPARYIYRRLADFFESYLDEALTAMAEFSSRVDALVVHALVPGGVEFCRRHGKPTFEVMMTPRVRAWQYPSSSVVRFLSLGPLNRFSYWVRDQFRNRAFGMLLKRVEEGMAHFRLPARSGNAPIRLHAYSHPLTLALSTARHEDVMTGYWFDDEVTTLAPNVDAFLQGGPQAVCVTFGSWGKTAHGDYRTSSVFLAFERIQDALQRQGVRALFLTPWSISTNRHTLVVPEASYDAVFPRVKTVIHHASAGSLHPAVRAGTPSVVLPIDIDQFFWARMANLQGVSPRPASIRKVHTRQLISLLKAAGSETVRNNTRILAEKVSSERGVEGAVDAISRGCVRNSEE